MKHEAVIVQYHGIHTSDLTKNSIFSLINEIHEEGPSSATVRATFTKTFSKSTNEKEYRGMVHVHSKAGSFFTAATHENLMEVAERVLCQMRRKMDKWKSNRISRKSLRRTEPSFGEEYYESSST
ncbi:MAG: hypothetical protein K2X47_11945 [Bdellovibrionales bacterium]|nr:hypothetical protein [Bdellovibrionales bacterium]